MRMLTLFTLLVPLLLLAACGSGSASKATGPSTTIICSKEQAQPPGSADGTSDVGDTTITVDCGKHDTPVFAPTPVQPAEKVSFDGVRSGVMATGELFALAAVLPAGALSHLDRHKVKYLLGLAVVAGVSAAQYLGYIPEPVAAVLKGWLGS